MAKKVGKNSLKKVGRSELGSGISALFGNSSFDDKLEEDKEGVVKELSNTIAMLPIEQIEFFRDQPRSEFDEEALQELSESIRVHGLIQPITVRRLSPHEYQLISGERRLRASKMVGLEEVPAYIRVANDQEMLEMALVENIQREDLNAIEVALTYQRLLEECELKHEELANRVGKSRTTITNHLGLLKLPIEIKKAVQNRTISMGHARALKGLENYALQQKFFRETVSQHLSVRALEERINKYREQKNQQGSKTTAGLPLEYENVQQRFRNFFGTRNGLKLKMKGKDKGQIVINFDSVEELNKLLDRIDD